MLAIVIPAHNEASSIGACVQAAHAALTDSDLGGEDGTVIVVADACSDETAAIAAQHGAHVLSIDARNVGRARAVGAEHALAHGARWLAFTDADTCVAPDWLSQQLALDADAVCGIIEVDDWSEHVEAVRAQFFETYTPVDGHRHIHGANLGVSARAYRQVGGFAPFSHNEDVAFVDALRAAHYRIAWSAAVRVTTSARVDFRAPGGFGAALVRASRAVLAACEGTGHTPHRLKGGREVCARCGQTIESPGLRLPGPGAQIQPA